MLMKTGRLLISSDGWQSSSGTMSDLWSPGSDHRSPQRVRSDPWVRGDHGATASSAGGAGL